MPGLEANPWLLFKPFFRGGFRPGQTQSRGKPPRRHVSTLHPFGPRELASLFVLAKLAGIEYPGGEAGLSLTPSALSND